MLSLFAQTKINHERLVIVTMDGKLNYEVNKEKGTIVAWKDNLFTELLEKIVDEKLLEKNGFCGFDILSDEARAGFIAYFLSKCFIPDKIVVKTRLHGEDIWDEEKGIKIARTKWRRKYNHECRKALTRFRKHLSSFTRAIIELENEYSDRAFSYEQEYLTYRKENA